MNFSDRKQQLLLQKLSSAGLLQAEQSVANDQPRREERHGPAVLSSAQRRMWYHTQLSEGSAAYNFCLILRPAMDSSFSIPALTKALEQVVLQHEILRTRYEEGPAGIPEQIVESYMAPRVTEIDLALAEGGNDLAVEDRLDELARQARDEFFDLKVDAPLRTLIIRNSSTAVAVILALPHIAGDGGSFGIVLADLERAYGHSANPDVLPSASSIRYTDYAAWEQRHLGIPQDPASLHAKQLRFWEAELADLPVELALPFDHDRPAVPSFAGSQIRRWLGKGLCTALRRTAKTYGATPLAALQSAVAVALNRIGAGQDIPLGTAVDLRQHSTLDRLVGFFSNTVVVRVNLASDLEFSALLRRVHDTSLKALDNRDAPFESVVEHINPPRVAARNPLFGVMVTATRPWPTLQLGDTTMALTEPRQTQAKFDLTFVIHDEGADGRIGVSVLYACDLFDDATAQHLLELVIGILGQAMHHPELRLSQLAEFGYKRLSAKAASLASILAKHRQTSETTTRAIRLAEGINERDVVAALVRLLERHDALRLRRDTRSGQWNLADAADLWETPILLRQATDSEETQPFSARLCTPPDDHATPATILELRAPGHWIDDESWKVLLAELSSVRANGGATALSAVGSYADWLTQTADFATRTDMVSHTEAWLDMLEMAAEGAATGNRRDGPVATSSRSVTLANLEGWPGHAAIRTAAVAAMLWVRHGSAAPLLIEIEEPDRDRYPQSTLENVVGWCRRSFPIVVTAPQTSADECRLTSSLIDRFIHAARQVSGLDNADALTGDFAVSYFLAREVSPDVAGVLNEAPLPDVTLSITMTDEGDASISCAEPVETTREHWSVRLDTRQHQASLSIRARCSTADVDALMAVWVDALPQFLAKVSHANGEVLEEEGTLVELSSWDRRRLEESFGPVREVLPLSPLQEGLRFHAVGAAQDANEVYISQTSLDLFGEIDAQRLHRAVKKAIALTPTVTAGFGEIAGQMVQVLPADIDIPWRSEKAADEEQAQRIADQEYGAEFNATRPPLIRFALISLPDGKAGVLHRLLLTAHHILLDGWSIRLLYRLVIQLYLDPENTVAPPAFTRYLQWLTQQNMVEAENVWRDVLAGTEPTILYPAARGLEASAKYSHECTASIGANTTSALSSLARSASTTLSSVLELAWGTLLMRMSGSSNVVFGNVVSGRSAEIENVNEIIGLLFNTVPVRVQVHGQESVRTALGALHAQKAVSLRHSQLNLARLQQIAGHSPIFDTLFSIQNLPTFDLPKGGEIRIGDATVRDATHYPLSLSITPKGQAIDLRLMFRSDVIAPDKAEAMLQAYAHVLNHFAVNADRPLLAIDALPDASPLLPRSIAGEDREIGTLSVAGLLVKQATATPNENAVTANNVKLTFNELATSAHQLAHLLHARGVQSEHRVALMLPRSELMIIALFGVFAAHAAYVPIDLETPAGRIRSILDQSQPSVILSVSALTGRLPPQYKTDPRIVLLDEPAIQRELANLPGTLPETGSPVNLNHLAYIIFTSGSTGEPKGVAVPYLGLTNMFINHKKEIFAPVLAAQGGRKLKIAHTTSFAFDASWEQLLWLLAGHEVYVIDDELRRDPDRLLLLFDREKIDAFDVTPTYGSYLVEHGLLERERPQGRDGTGIVFVSLGGEAVGRDLWTRLREAPGVGAYNLYGPTEYTINALGADLADNAEPTVGRPIANTHAYILGPGLLPSPVGVTGELYLGGAGLARGYVGRPTATAERFIANPFGRPGERIYRTGDLARWRADGGIDYLGRADNQLKIRGYRIEPAEIENALVKQTSVKRAAVVGRATQDGDIRLVAYVVCDRQLANAEGLREQLRLQLPSYMVPAVIVFVDDLPRTLNGKLDIASLPDPVMTDSKTAQPVNETERTICDLFAQVLERQSVGRFDDFFESGGHSLLTVRLVSLLRETIVGPTINVRQIYDHPTPAALALSIRLTDNTAQGQTSLGNDNGDTSTMVADTVLPADITLANPSVVLPTTQLATINTVLLTGATGFVGSFVLAELLQNSNANIHCLVRAKDEASALERIHKSLSLYGLWDDIFRHRLVGLPGDLSQPRLGLTAETFATLADELDIIIHNGASTNEFDPYSRLAGVNVGSAKEILRLASRGRRVTPVHLVSTASVVARRGPNPPIITEETRLTADEVGDGGYVQTKWVAEELMHAAAARGLPVTVHRLGRVSGHSTTGICSTTVGFWHFVRSMLVLQAAPALRSDHLTLAPVDYVAKALVALIEHGDAGATYHISNRMQTSVGAIVEAARRAGHRLEVMSLGAWRECLTRVAEERAGQGDDSLYSILALMDHIHKYDGPEVESFLGQEKIEAALDGTGIAPPPVTSAMLDRYIAYFMKVGFFPAVTEP